MTHNQQTDRIDLARFQKALQLEDRIKYERDQLSRANLRSDEIARINLRLRIYERQYRDIVGDGE